MSSLEMLAQNCFTSAQMVEKVRSTFNFFSLENGMVFKHEDKAKEIERHFGEVVGTKRSNQLL
jgi:hypothetical protein